MKNYKKRSAYKPKEEKVLYNHKKYARNLS